MTPRFIRTSDGVKTIIIALLTIALAWVSISQECDFVDLNGVTRIESNPGPLSVEPSNHVNMVSPVLIKRPLITGNHELVNVIGDKTFNDELKEYFKMNQIKGVCVDVGANSGKFTEEMKRIVTCDHTYLFEPDSKLFSGLNMNVNFLNDVIINEAISDRSGIQKFYSCSTEQNSLSSDASFGCPEVIAKVRGINDLLEKLNPSFLKLDTEGFDDLIIQSVDNWFNVIVLFFEYNTKQFQKTPNYSLKDTIVKLTKDFDCYFIGDKLTYLNMWRDKFEIRSWSNVACFRTMI